MVATAPTPRSSCGGALQRLFAPARAGIVVRWSDTVLSASEFSHCGDVDEFAAQVICGHWSSSPGAGLWTMFAEKMGEFSV